MQQLCFEIRQSELLYNIVDSSNKTPIQKGSIPINGRVSELKKEECASFIINENLLNFSGEVSLSFANPKVTLVPQIIFGDSNAKDIFELCFGESQETIEHNRFYEQMVVVVYEIEEWIKRFFVLRFPRIIIQHETTHALRGIFNGNSFEPKLHLIVNDTFFTVILVAKNKIFFFNTFEFSNENDIFYYANHVWNNSEFSSKKKEIVWHFSASDDELFVKFENLYISVYQKDNYLLSRIPKINHQLLCV